MSKQVLWGVFLKLAYIETNNFWSYELNHRLGYYVVILDIGHNTRIRGVIVDRKVQIIMCSE